MEDLVIMENTRSKDRRLGHSFQRKNCSTDVAKGEGTAPASASWFADRNLKHNVNIISTRWRREHEKACRLVPPGKLTKSWSYRRELLAGSTFPFLVLDLYDSAQAEICQYVNTLKLRCDIPQCCLSIIWVFSDVRQCSIPAGSINLFSQFSVQAL